MALTENTFTGEEFSAALAANPDLLPIVTGTLTTNKFIVQNETEHQSFLTNHESVVAQKLTKSHAETLEKDVFELTGIAKNNDEKYYDYFKRATGEKLSSVTKLEGELATLKAGHSPSAADKARITELEQAIATTKTEYGDKLTAKEKEILTIKGSSQVNTDLAEIRTRYKAGLPDGLVKLAEQTVIGAVLSKISVQEDGTITILKEDGTVKLNPSTYKPITVSEELSESLKDLIDAGKQQGGTGTKKDDVGGAGGDKKFTGLPADVTTKVQLDQHLKKLGFVEDTDEYNKLFDEHGKNLKLR